MPVGVSKASSGDPGLLLDILVPQMPQFKFFTSLSFLKAHSEEGFAEGEMQWCMLG